MFNVDTLEMITFSIVIQFDRINSYSDVINRHDRTCSDT